jgi:hypothetical protein
VSRADSPGPQPPASAGDREETTVSRADSHGPQPPASAGDPLVIDCDDCAMQGSDCCADCVVTFICSRQPGEAVVIDVAEERAIRLLSSAGLLPELRHRRRTG